MVSPAPKLGALVLSMQLSGSTEVALAIFLIAMVWLAGAVWIKACDYVEGRRTQLARSGTRPSMRGLSRS